MHRRSTLLALLFAGAVALFAYLVVEPWLAASRAIWPQVAKPEQLLAEAAALCAAHSNRSSIPESQWPGGMKALHPRHLTTETGYVLVTLSTGGINPGWGYAIYPDGRTNNPANAHRQDASSIHPGIFRVRHIE